MNSSRGVTTTNLIIYVIAMLIVIGIIATITSFFYTNVTNLEDNSIYMNSSKISENIKDLKFSLEEINSKKVITVLITIGENLEYTKTTKYVMN